jgi:2-polyprenyl-6-methoxyphenol hydroxylase-like FAD-dependent oxidoreductase
MASVERILIVGGGIAGLSLATALHRRGYGPELVERSPVWPAVGAGINLPANGVRALRALGVGDVVDNASAMLRSWGFFDQHGALLCRTDLEELWRAVGPCLGIARVRLQQALLGGAAAVPHRLRVSLTALTQNDDRVSVGFSDGAAGDYDLVVGADGIHSTVRDLTIGTVPPRYAGTMVWRSIVPTRPPGLSDIMVFMGDWFPWARATPTALGPLAGPASTIRCRAGWSAFGTASRDSVGRYRPISLPCSGTTSSALGRSNGSSPGSGIATERS